MAPRLSLRDYVHQHKTQFHFSHVGRNRKWNILSLNLQKGILNFNIFELRVFTKGSMWGYVEWEGKDGEVGMENGVQELIDNLGKIALVRENPTVIVIVHSGAGLEILSTTGDFVMKMGMLDVAKLTVVDVHTQMNAENAEECRRAGEQAVAALAMKPGKAN